MPDPPPTLTPVPVPGPGAELLAPADEDAAVVADLAIVDAVEWEFAAVDMAMARLDDGTYWTCEACGGPIGEATLAEGPFGRRCGQCAGSDDRAPRVSGA